MCALPLLRLPQGGITLGDVRDLCGACTREMVVAGELCQYKLSEVGAFKRQVNALGGSMVGLRGLSGASGSREDRLIERVLDRLYEKFGWREEMCV